jgi:hypothetical protein
MLPTCSCGQSLGLRSNFIWRKRTADMTKHIFGSQGECLKMDLHIGDQEFESSPLMSMGDHPSRDAPEPFNTVGIGIIGRRRDEIQLLLHLGEPGSRTSREPAAVCVLRLSTITIATRPRRFERATAARTCSQNTSAVREGGHPATLPAITPVEQAKARDLAVVSRGLDQALPTPPFSTPDTREGWMKGKLHLIRAR